MCVALKRIDFSANLCLQELMKFLLSFLVLRVYCFPAKSTTFSTAPCLLYLLNLYFCSDSSSGKTMCCGYGFSVCSTAATEVAFFSLSAGSAGASYFDSRSTLSLEMGSSLPSVATAALLSTTSFGFLISPL